MGKKITNKLAQYKFNFSNEWWEKNKLAGEPLDALVKTDKKGNKNKKG